MQIIRLILSVILILCCCSCTINVDKPDTVTIEEKEYKRAFVGELYPIDDPALNEGINVSGNYYYKYSKPQYDCYVAYDRNAEPNVYFELSVFDEAISYYGDKDNFNFFCLLGNIHDNSEQQIFEMKEIDDSMLSQLLKFTSENDYNPFSSANKENELKKVPIANPDNWIADEIHFFKESKDGAFSTSKGYTFIMLDERLCILYQYDFGDANNPHMLLSEIPKDISDYFCALIKGLRITV